MTSYHKTFIEGDSKSIDNAPPVRKRGQHGNSPIPQGGVMINPAELNKLKDALYRDSSKEIAEAIIALAKNAENIM